jgi:hypothetical protein
MKRWAFVWATALSVLLLVGCQSRLKAYDTSKREALPVELYLIYISTEGQQNGFACSKALELHTASRAAAAALEVPDDEIAIETQDALLEYLDAGIALYTECGDGTTDNTADLASHETFLTATEKYFAASDKLTAAIEGK